YRWRLLREKLLHHRSYTYKQPTMYLNNDRIFGYNLIKRSKYFHSVPIDQVIHLPKKEERIVVITSASIRFYDLREFKLTNEVILTKNKNALGTNFEQSFTRLAYASKIDIFIGWRPGGNTLWPLSRENLNYIGFPSTIKNKLIGVFSNSNSGTIISLELKSFNSQPDDCYWILFARHWQFQFTKIQLIPNRNYSQDCRLIVGWKYSAWLRCIQCDKHFSSIDYNGNYDDDDNEKLLESVNFQMFQKSAITHNSQITAVLFFSPLKILITGDACGTIKTWNMEQVQLTILHGHLGEIIHFSIHRWDLIRPHDFYSISPSFISISKDGLLKCWQFWQSNYAYSVDNSLKSFNLSEIISNYKTIHTTINEVDSRQTLMNLYSKVMSKTNCSLNTVHTIHDVIMNSNTGDIVLVGVHKNYDTCNIQQKCQEEYYMEHWTLSEPCSPLAEFPQIVKHISFMRLNDLYEMVTPEAYKSYSSTKCQNDNSINIAIVICEGKPGSVHLLSTLNGSILTSAICNDTIEDAVWHWMLEKLYVLQSNGTIAVFSTIVDRAAYFLCGHHLIIMQFIVVHFYFTQYTARTILNYF
ncbi:hypothetical protein EWB00_007891, partial [Schistosoma japonicum]